MLSVCFALQEQLRIEVRLGRLDRLDQLFGLTRQLIEIRDIVLGRFGVGGSTPHRGKGRESGDRVEHVLERNRFRYLRGKLQDCASFDCRRRSSAPICLSVCRRPRLGYENATNLSNRSCWRVTRKSLR